MSLFNEIETCADPDAHEPELVEIEKHLRKGSTPVSGKNW